MSDHLIRWAKYLIAILVAYVTYLLIIKSYSYSSFYPKEGFLISKGEYYDKAIFRWGFYVHAFTSVFTLLAGGIQFSTTILRKHVKLHRYAGYTYALLVIFVCGPSGLVIATYANGGLSSRVSFMLQGILWIVCTVVALISARNKDWSNHIVFITRSYALALGAVSLRIYAYILPEFFNTYPLETYLTTAWLSWVGNLILAEGILFMGWIKLPGLPGYRS